MRSAALAAVLLSCTHPPTPPSTPTPPAELPPPPAGEGGGGGTSTPAKEGGGGGTSPKSLLLPAPPADAPVIANPSAPLVAQLFLDPSDPRCSDALAAVDAIERDFPGEVRFVWRFAPSDDGSDELAGWAILQAEAHRQKGAAALWQMHRTLCAHHDALSMRDLDRYARDAALDVGELDAALGDHRFAKPFARDERVMRDAGVPRGAIVVGTLLADPARPADAVRAARAHVAK